MQRAAHSGDHCVPCALFPPWVGELETSHLSIVASRKVAAPIKDGVSTRAGGDVEVAGGTYVGEVGYVGASYPRKAPSRGFAPSVHKSKDADAGPVVNCREHEPGIRVAL